VSATCFRLVCHRDYRAAARPRVARLDEHVRRGRHGTQPMRAPRHWGRRIAKPGRPHHERRCSVPREPSTCPNYAAPASPMPCSGATLDRGQHISKRNIWRLSNHRGSSCGHGRRGLLARAAEPTLHTQPSVLAPNGGGPAFHRWAGGSAHEEAPAPRLVAGSGPIAAVRDSSLGVDVVTASDRDRRHRRRSPHDRDRG
jgi:hypothetical protein